MDRRSPLRVHLAGWLLLPFVAALNGTIRELTYAHAMTTSASHSLSVIPLVLFIAAWAGFLARRRPLADRSAALSVGLAWLVGTVAFETMLGLGTGRSLGEVVAQYDLTRSLWVLVPLATLIAPVLAQRLTRPSTCVAAPVG
jgi:hypothetical protein